MQILGLAVDQAPQIRDHELYQLPDLEATRLRYGELPSEFGIK